MFFGREYELRRLKELLDKPTSSLVTCRGRRRIGKSTLFEHFAALNRCRFIKLEGIAPRSGEEEGANGKKKEVTDEDQRAAFGRQLADQTRLPEVVPSSWTQAFAFLDSVITDDVWTVVLLDEIEKAHPDVFNILLQVLDDGRLTDNKGRVADFKNCIIIMTSNLGSDIIQNNYAEAGNESNEALFERTKVEVMALLKKTLRPEFVNRIDEIVMFQPLSKREIRSIVNMQIDNLNKLLAQQNLQVEFTKYALDQLVEMGYEPLYGARPLKRVIQRNVLNELSKFILEGNVQKDGIITVDSLDDGQFVFYNKGDNTL